MQKALERRIATEPIEHRTLGVPEVLPHALIPRLAQRRERCRSIVVQRGQRGSNGKRVLGLPAVLPIGWRPGRHLGEGTRFEAGGITRSPLARRLQ